MKPYKELRKRIERDKERKRETQEARRILHDDMDMVATYTNAVKAHKKINNAVSYKRSVQLFNDNCVIRITELLDALKAGRLPDVATDRECQIRERGKARTITPIRPEDRFIQHIISDNAITPMITPKLIRQNCANQTGKGTCFARDLVWIYLEAAKRLWGDDFCAWTFDFRNFFGSIRHRECTGILTDAFTDVRIINVSKEIIRSYELAKAKRRAAEGLITQEDLEKIRERLRTGQGVGICLGSQISQDMAISVPGPIDRHIKKTMPFFVRFADDGVVFWDSKEDLRRLQAECEEIARRHGLAFNTKKTAIVPIRKGFTFLKVHYRVVGSRTVDTMDRSGTVRMHRKLRKYRHLVDDGRMAMADVDQSLQSWTAHTTKTRRFHTLKAVKRLYNKLYKGGGQQCITTESPRGTASSEPAQQPTSGDGRKSTGSC